MEWEFLKLIGAKKSNWILKTGKIHILEDKFKEGNLTKKEFDELSKSFISSDPFIDKDGNPFVLYIYDRTFPNNSYGTDEYKFKFHFKKCRTIKYMNVIGRNGRYKKKEDIENEYFPQPEKRRGEKLKVCKNCLHEFDFKKSKFTVDGFNMIEFFNIYGKQDLEEPTHQHYKHSYLDSWTKTSFRHRESNNWICEICGTNMENDKKNFHTHHKNGVKDDDKRTNLQALCRKCHASQPQHQFMKNN